MDVENLEEHLNCVICLDLKLDVNESTCCHQIFCGECYISIKTKPCPLCKAQNFQIIPSVPIRRMISLIRKTCPFECGSQFSMEEMEKHKKSCPNQIRICNIEGCQFQGNKISFMKHIIELHEDMVVSKFAVNSSEKVVESLKMSLQLTIDKKNSNGDQCRRGLSGKFYCGKKLNGFCSCCDGNCGPGNGCNCRGCMVADMEVRGLGRGILVNREGYEAEYINGYFFCGRKDCNPLQKNACLACKKLIEQKQTRYFGLV